MAKKKDLSLISVLNKYDLNEKQIIAVEAIRNKKIVVLRGEAGTAKTFAAVYGAMKLLSDGDVNRIAITRPLVTTEKMGYLPGDIAEKMDPFLYPVISFFNKFGDAGEKTFEALVTADKVRRAPIAFMRGTTVDEEVLIVDEAQNITSHQMLMILTRLGRNGKIIITGDEQQDDLNLGVRNSSIHTGLDCVKELAKKLPYIEDIVLTENMRDPLVTEIISHWPMGVAA